MHQIFQREKYLLDKEYWKQIGLEYFASYNSMLDFEKSLYVGCWLEPIRKWKAVGKRKLFSSAESFDEN